jgi:hypothetical protein
LSSYRHFGSGQVSIRVPFQPTGKRLTYAALTGSSLLNVHGLNSGVAVVALDLKCALAFLVFSQMLQRFQRFNENARRFKLRERLRAHVLSATANAGLRKTDGIIQLEGRRALTFVALPTNAPDFV